jgi:hypothetical protein
VESLPEILGSLVIDTTGLGPDGRETPGKLFPVKRIFQGYELSKSVSREAMSNPESLQPFLELAQNPALHFLSGNRGALHF